MVSIYQSNVDDALIFKASYHALREYRSHYSHRTLQYIAIIIGLVMNPGGEKGAGTYACGLTRT
jgi:hypothetical protein